MNKATKRSKRPKRSNALEVLWFSAWLLGAMVYALYEALDWLFN